MTDRSRRLTRRRLLAYGGIGAAFIIAGWTEKTRIYRWLREYTYPSHIAGGADETPFDTPTQDTLTAFTEIFFGHRFSRIDDQDLRSRIDFLVREDGGWRPQFRYLARQLDTEALKSGASSFRTANENVKIGIVARIVSPDDDSDWVFPFSDSARNLLLMRNSTVKKLQMLYLNSGIPWRRRGYESWRGVPGDMLEYTRPGSHA